MSNDHKRYLAIHTGGTIGMVQTSTGLITAPSIVEDTLARLNDRLGGGREIQILTIDPLIDSADIIPANWTQLAGIIWSNYNRYDGFLVTHGTDTIAYTAAALSFALDGLDKPVILTGSMVPLSIPDSDGNDNLRDGLESLSCVSAGVWVQFSGSLIPGTRIIKISSNEVDAFTCSALDEAPRLSGSGLTYYPYNDADIVTITLTPGISGSFVDTALKFADAAVLRCYGAGTAPSSDALSDAVQGAYIREVPVLAVSQCLRGGLRLGEYRAGTYLQKCGVIDGRDITTEAAVAKLLHVLSREQSFERRRSLLSRPLCGEMAA